MDIQIKDLGGVKVAVVAGEIDGSTSSALERAVTPLIQEGAAVVLDLGGTTYVSSAGLRILLLVHREAGARHARLALAGVSRDIKDVMSSTGFLRFFELADTAEEAVSMVAWAPAAPSVRGPSSSGARIS